MELNNKPTRRANEFWPLFIKSRLFLLFFSQILLFSLIGFFLVITNTFSYDSMLLWLILLISFMVSFLFNLLLVSSTLKPLKDMISAILHVSGEGSTLEMPNLNSKHNEKFGLKDALQTIFNLASNNIEPGAKNNIEIKSKGTDLSTMLDSSSCGFIAMDHEGKIIYSNKIAPVSTDSNGNKHLGLFFSDEDTLELWLDECEKNKVRDEHLWTRVPDRLPNEEGRRFFDVLVSYNKGVEAEVIICLVDRTSVYITDEENLDFLSFAAHELRGPITVIRGYLDVLEDELEEKLEGDQRELFHRLVISANRLSGYINNILNTSKYDRRHLKMNLAEETVNKVYDMICDDMDLRAKAQNRLLSINFPSELPTIAADRNSLSEVFSNLIDNAIKYSNEGGAINVSARTNGDFVDFIVQDNGIGMPESVVSNLFQKFYRSHRSRETVAGTGIGLYICKAIVESHGGSISVRSEEGKGSVFTASIPIYSTVADKLHKDNNSNQGLIDKNKNWINNHTMFKG